MGARERKDARGREYAALWSGVFCARCDCGVCSCGGLGELALAAAYLAGRKLALEADPDAKKNTEGCPF